MRRTRTQILLIIGGALVAVIVCIMLTSMLVNQFNLFADGAAHAAPADTASASASASAPSPSVSASSASPSSSPSDSASDSSSFSSGVCASHVHYYASEANHEYEFGPAVTDDSKAGVLTAMKTRFCNGDPAFTSAIQGYTAYVHTGNSDELLGIDGQTDSFIHDRTQWRDEVDTLITKLQDASTNYTTADVPPGTSSLCMVAKGDTYSVTRCPTAEDGTAAVFTTSDGDVYSFRIDCGLQPVSLTKKFPSVIPVAPKDPSVDPNSQGNTSNGSANANSGTDRSVAPSHAPKPSATRHTNPAPPSSSVSSSSSQSTSGSASGSGTASSSSGSAHSSSSSSTRSTPPPENGAPGVSNAPSTAACAPGIATC
jgi:cytoskeletal protein RodZ